MLVVRPDVADDKAQAVIDKATRQIVASGGQIVKVAPWGRRRLAYQIDRFREGSYHIVLFEAPGAALVELERTLLITEEVLRHLVARVGATAPTRTATSPTTPTCRRPRMTTVTNAQSGSTSPRPRRPRPPSTEGAPPWPSAR
jgi:small subunit ribosomal protein S6